VGAVIAVVVTADRVTAVVDAEQPGAVCGGRVVDGGDLAVVPDEAVLWLRCGTGRDPVELEADDLPAIVGLERHGRAGARYLDCHIAAAAGAQEPPGSRSVVAVFVGEADDLAPVVDVSQLFVRERVGRVDDRVPAVRLRRKERITSDRSA
jgi:hypothetical protein